MTRAVYVAAGEAESNKGTVALGLVELLSRQVESVGVFRPVVREGREDALINTIRSRFQLALPYDACAGVTYGEVHADVERAAGDVVARYRALARQCDAVVVIGTDYTDVGAPTEFGFNARLAADLGTPVINVVNARGRTPAQVAAAVELSSRELAHHHARELAVVVTRAAEGLAATSHPTPVFVLPETSSLRAPTVADLLNACDGRLFLGERDGLGREVSALMVGAMSLPGILDRLTEGAAVIIPSDRAAALLPGLIAAHTAPGFPALSAVVMTGGTDLPAPVDRLLSGMATPLPVITTEHDTFDTAARLSAVEGRFTPEAGGKIDTALRLFSEHVDGRLLLERLAIAKTDVVTPLMFEYELLDRARARRRHIVLPEGEEPRILRAADILLRRGVAELTLLGDEERIRVQAAQLGLDLAGAGVISPFDKELRERFAREYAAVRAHRGMTVELARDTVTDVSYFGTLMVHTGMADGMVSGSTHTTAHTIRPAFEILRLGLVSSVFFMCLADRVLVYGDCAVNPHPTAEQLADIAISSARTAALFGVEPRIAMLSYSTGTSGAGADVDKVRAATELVRERRPDLQVEGPIQYDAAVDPAVARTKMPESQVAGRATVFVVPDLNTGNNLYKAVQRSAGAVAVGPVLQGLRKPVNDLSRGATVADIVTTVAVTAAQARDERARHEDELPEAATRR
ncbi:phosphate acetyltransferase [Nonomuraea muscovyensis]|uniref:Phosphate acetyltransferase n=1 Tax=Nonomuraea muscovyensis TaxID=1124761 RepID=A0A7X0C4C4_9ACTN|nr:phosphate acetyltransferase [Nonomuraea muscovyensis]MBB6347933.1 phosphate acetyltransferase [Nonomuraea muscovyensis]MDF2704372.1 phosphate acetyltransferase [Nonomuraea muscovyensis]